MSKAYRLWEQAQVIDLLTPAADAGGRTSSYFTLKNGHKAYVVCKVAQGNAAQVTFSPLQASAVAGTGSKAIGNAPIVANLDTATSDALVAAAAAATYQTDAALKNKLVIFEIDPAEVMDVANRFTSIAVQTSASNASNVTEALLIITPLRFAQATPPSAAVD